MNVADSTVSLMLFAWNMQWKITCKTFLLYGLCVVIFTSKYCQFWWLVCLVKWKFRAPWKVITGCDFESEYFGEICIWCSDNMVSLILPKNMFITSHIYSYCWFLNCDAICDIKKWISILFQTSDRFGEEDIPVLDPESGLQANNCKDFQVFINLVDLMRDVFISADCMQFEKWIQPFCYQVIYESSHKPLVSGFYKLLTVALQLCDRLNYFGVSTV
jgi:hypothetical protein